MPVVTDGDDRLAVLVATLLSNLLEVRFCWQEKSAAPTLIEQAYAVSAGRTGTVSKPSFIVDQDLVEALQELGLPSKSIASPLAISR